MFTQAPVLICRHVAHVIGSIRQQAEHVVSPKS